MTIYLIGGIVLLLIYILFIFNKLVQLNNFVKEAFSTMDVYLKKRWDLIPNIVETVKGYAKHEKETLSEITNLRNATYDKMSDNQKLKTNQQLDIGISKLMMIVENYPDLKSNQSFIDLSKELSKVEEDIANSRKFYNANVRDFNNRVEMFPSNIIAKLFRYKSKDFFESNENERENIKVKL